MSGAVGPFSKTSGEAYDTWRSSPYEFEVTGVPRASVQVVGRTFVLSGVYSLEGGVTHNRIETTLVS